MTSGEHKVLNIILALLVSIVGWTFVVYNYEPTIDVKYKDIPVQYIGQEELADKDLGIVADAADPETVDIILTQKRVNTGNISADSIGVKADVSEATEGENSIVLQITSPDGTSIKESSRRSVTVTAERADRVDMDVNIQYADTGGIEVEPVIDKLTSTRATVIGASSVVNNVAGVTAFLEYTENNSEFRTFTREVYAVDKQGEIIPNVVIYPSDINFAAKPGYLKKVAVKVNVSGEKDDYYTRTYTAPKTILVKGDRSVIELLDSIETEEVDLSYYYEDSEAEIIYVFPEGVYPANGTEATDTMKIKVKKTEDEEDSEDSKSSSKEN